MEPSVWEPQTQGNHMYLSLAESVSAVQSSCPQVISNSVFHFQSVLVKDKTGTMQGMGRRMVEWKKVVNRTGFT